MKSRLCLLLAAAAMAGAVPPARAQTAPALTIGGHVAHARAYTAAELAALPHEGAELPAAHGGGGGARHVSGVRLWPLLDAAGWVDAPGRKTHLQHVVLARGRDGYAVALSIGELDPGLEGKRVLVVTDGERKGALGLYVPGDANPPRRVHDLVALDIQ